MAYTLRPAQPRHSCSLGEKFMGLAPGGHSLHWTTDGLMADGQPFFGISGEIHYSRLDPCRWADDLRKMRGAGVNVASAYVFWNHHEEIQGKFDFSGRRDLRRFVSLCGELGLKVILRLGPFNHGEVRNGGVPDWVYGLPLEPRSLDPGFLRLVRRLYGEIAHQVQGLLYKDGGPVIAAQLDNEYMHSAALWEDTRGTTNEYVNSSGDGEAYLLALKGICREAGLDVPFYTCTAWGGAAAPHGECIPLWGGYPYAPWLISAQQPVHPATEEYLYRDCRHAGCRRYHSFDPQYTPEAMPFACCEMGGGMQVSYDYRFQVDPRSVDALANVKVGSGCNFVGYYMFCGGTNPIGKKARFLNELWCPKLSYDYQAPVGEFGQVRNSLRRLRLLHGTLDTFGTALYSLPTALPESADTLKPGDTDTLRYAARRNEDMGFLFLNNFQDHTPMHDQDGIVFELETDQGPLRIPEAGELSLSAGESCVLPFGLQVLGDTLRYATVQPVYIQRATDGEHWFCFCPEGMRGEMVFASGPKLTFSGLDMETREISLPEGRLMVTCLSRKKALGLGKVLLHGKPRIIWSDADITWDGEGLLAESTVPGADLILWPDGLKPPITSRLCFDLPEIPLRLHSLSDTRHVLVLPKGCLQGVQDAWLRIEYEGDTAQLFRKGELVADHFHNGEAWEVGLPELKKTCLGRELTLHIVPRKQGVHVARDAMAAVTETVEGQCGRLISTRVVPVSRVRIDLKEDAL